MTSTTPRTDRPRNKKIRKAAGPRARLLAACCGLALVVGGPAVARAEEDASDARLQGYATASPAMTKGGVAPTWLLFIALSIIGCSVLFKNAKRSHLD